VVPNVVPDPVNVDDRICAITFGVNNKTFVKLADCWIERINESINAKQYPTFSLLLGDELQKCRGPIYSRNRDISKRRKAKVGRPSRNICVVNVTSHPLDHKIDPKRQIRPFHRDVPIDESIR
jgi:hypothetical protein